MSSAFLDAILLWPQPNYLDPVTHGQGIIVTNVIFGVLAVIAVVLRIYSRVRITRTFGADDVLIVLATIFAIAMYAVMSVGSANFGWDRHVWDIPFGKLTGTRKLNTAFQITFTLASGLTKMSLLWFCHRLYGKSSKTFANLNYLLLTMCLAVVAVCTVSFSFIILLGCIPIKASWDLLPDYPYHCLNGDAFILAGSIINTITDFACTLVPMTLIWRLQMRNAQKIAVISLFGLGVLINIAGALRTYFFYKSMFITNLDMTWVDWPTWISASVEIGLGLIVTSAPALRPLISYYLPRLFSDVRTTSSRITGRRSRSRNGAVFLKSTSRSDHRSQSDETRHLHHYGNGDGVSSYSVEGGKGGPLLSEVLLYGTTDPKARSVAGAGKIEVTQTVELKAFYHQSGGAGANVMEHEHEHEHEPAKDTKENYSAGDRQRFGVRIPLPTVQPKSGKGESMRYLDV